MDNDNEWKVVTASDKKRVMRKKRNCFAMRRKGVAHPTAESATAVDNANGELRAIITRCRAQLESTVFYQQLLVALSKKRTGAATEQTLCCEIDHILCLGVGNFSKTSSHHFSPSLWQIACALQLRDDLHKRNQTSESKSGLDEQIGISYYDVVSTSVEEEFLSTEFGVRVLARNEEGKHRIERPATSTTLCFMPHCPLFLYENIVAENWDQLQSIIILGNSLQNHLHSLVQPPPIPTPYLQKAVTSMVETLLDDTMVKERGKKSSATAPAEFTRAFNDTSLTYFQAQIKEELSLKSDITA